MGSWLINPPWDTSKNALAIESGAELERFDLGTVVIGRTTYTVLTGYEVLDHRCFWCGGELHGKAKRYCSCHMKEYYRHFNWNYASSWALQRAGRRCENCGIAEGKLYSGSSQTNLEVHHIVPLKGGSRFLSAINLPWNLVCLCKACHQWIHAIMRNGHKKLPLDIWEAAALRGQSVMQLN